MSNTRSYLKAFGKGFSKIKDIICFPWDWACGEYDKSDKCFNSSTSSGSVANDVVATGVGIAVDGVCAIGTCIVRSPVACVGTAVSIPVGIGAGAIYTGLGIFGLAGVATKDLVTGNCSSQPGHQEMDGRNTAVASERSAARATTEASVECDAHQSAVSLRK